MITKYLKLLKDAKPVLWGETITLIQTRLMTRINPAQKDTLV